MSEPGIHLWYAALAEDYGIILKTNDQDRLIQKLYAIRREAKTVEFDNLSIIRPPNRSDEVWIVHKVIGDRGET